MPDRRVRVFVMVKEPRPGRVKTRLGREIGLVLATWWFRHQATALLRRLQDPRWQLVLAVSPDREGLSSRVWPRALPRVTQGTGDLGDRMGRLLHAAPPGPRLIVGADIPGINRKKIAEAIALLGRNEAVFGPAEDGGYWLVGWSGRRAPPPSLFRNVRWSSPEALSDSVASLGSCRIGYAATLSDVDTAADLIRLRQRSP